MYFPMDTLRLSHLQAVARASALACGCALTFAWPLRAQQTPPPPAQAEDDQFPAPSAPAAAEPAPQAPSAPAAASPQAPESSQTGGITEEELRQMLVGKPLYLRGGYMDNNLNFDEHGKLERPLAAGVLYTERHSNRPCASHQNGKIELDGARYGLSFMGQLANEDLSKMPRTGSESRPRRKRSRSPSTGSRWCCPRKKKNPNRKRWKRQRTRKANRSKTNRTKYRQNITLPQLPSLPLLRWLLDLPNFCSLSVHSTTPPPHGCIPGLLFFLSLLASIRCHTSIVLVGIYKCICDEVHVQFTFRFVTIFIEL